MPVTKDDVLAALGKVAAPAGAPLPKSGTLSDIVASDGKVFFSLTVDAAAVQAWEPVRKRAEEAVRAITRVPTAMRARRGVPLLPGGRNGVGGRAAGPRGGGGARPPAATAPTRPRRSDGRSRV